MNSDVEMQNTESENSYTLSTHEHNNNENENQENQSNKKDNANEKNMDDTTEAKEDQKDASSKTEQDSNNGTSNSMDANNKKENTVTDQEQSTENAGNITTENQTSITEEVTDKPSEENKNTDTENQDTEDNIIDVPPDKPFSRFDLLKPLIKKSRKWIIQLVIDFLNIWEQVIVIVWLQQIDQRTIFYIFFALGIVQALTSQLSPIPSFVVITITELAQVICYVVLANQFNRATYSLIVISACEIVGAFLVMQLEHREPPKKLEDRVQYTITIFVMYLFFSFWPFVLLYVSSSDFVSVWYQIFLTLYIYFMGKTIGQAFSGGITITANLIQTFCTLCCMCCALCFVCAFFPIMIVIASIAIQNNVGSSVDQAIFLFVVISLPICCVCGCCCIIVLKLCGSDIGEDLFDKIKVEEA